jgi:hypothetical protein
MRATERGFQRGVEVCGGAAWGAFWFNLEPIVGMDLVSHDGGG